MARGPCAGVRGARPRRARSLEVARCDRHRHRVRHGLEPRLAGTARRLLDLAERCAAVLLGGARFRQAAPALRRVPLRGAPGERSVRARGLLAALQGGGRLDAAGGAPHHRRGGASRFHRLGRPHRSRARGAAGARQPRRAERRARRGAAVGLAFLSSTWIAPAALGLAVLAAHLACPEWRGRNALPFWAASLIVGGALAISWPLALYARSPELFREWWALTSQPQGALGTNARYFLSTGSWFAWPAWPLAAWALWSMRRRLGEPRLFVPAFASLAILFGAACMGPPQDVNLLALLAPLALLASQGVVTLRRGAAAALDWFGVISFAFFVGLIWLGYMGMMTGVPPKVAANFARAAPGFTPQFNLLYFLLAAALTLAWFYIVLFAAPAPLRSVTRWAAGVVLLWGTFAMLWMPWADYQKSYRSVALELRSRIPAGAGCVAAKQLGVPQAAALDYHAGLRLRAFDMLKPQACPLLLVQGSPQQELDAPGAGWVKLADVGRPGDRGERYR